MKEPKTCAFCGKLFVPKQKNQKFCNYRCLQSSRPRGRFAIYNRDHFTCIYCGRSSIADGVVLAVDHIIPRARGGEDIAGNLVTACRQCNSEKSDRVLAPHLLEQIKRVVAQRNKRAGMEDVQLIDLHRK